MARQTKEEFRRKRKPSIFIVCEGRNKTEKTYFNHFNERNAPFNLRVFDSESTDITSMAKKATSLFIKYELDLDIGDKVYCLVDLDLEQSKYEKFLKARETYKKIEIIPSNPCFEIWLQYYFSKSPKVVSSSQKAKEETSKLIPGYTESMDVISVAKLGMKEHVQAIQNSEIRNSRYDDALKEVDKNPYTEVAGVVTELIRHKKGD